MVVVEAGVEEASLVVAAGQVSPAEDASRLFSMNAARKDALVVYWSLKKRRLIMVVDTQDMSQSRINDLSQSFSHHMSCRNWSIRRNPHSRRCHRGKYGTVSYQIEIEKLV